MNRRTMILGTVGGLVMRKNKPSLVDPVLAHDRVFAEDMGIVTPRTIGRHSVDLAKDKVEGGKPPILMGSWADSTASQNLAQLLHENGTVRDATEFGVLEDAPIGFSNMVLASALLAITPSTTDNVNYSDVYTSGLTFTYGTWVVQVMAEASFTNSAGAVNNVRLIEGSTTLDSIAPGSTATRERYVCAGADVLGPGSYTFKFQYKPNTAGPTATARAPWMILNFRRKS